MLLEYWKAADAPADAAAAAAAGARLSGMGATGSGAVLAEDDPPLDVYFVAARGAPPVVETTDDGMTLFWWAH